MKRAILVTAAVCALALPAVAAEKSPVVAGKWQVTVEMELGDCDK